MTWSWSILQKLGLADTRIDAAGGAKSREPIYHADPTPIGDELDVRGTPKLRQCK